MINLKGRTQCVSIALELARHNITVNAYAPGGIDTKMRASFPPKAFLNCIAEFSQTVRDAFARGESIEAQFLAATPVGRVGMPEEIASCVSWLTSEGAGFVTGERDLIQFLPRRIFTGCIYRPDRQRQRWNVL